MYDLIYAENYNDYKEIWDIIKKEYLNAVLEDGSDDIHENRFSVDCNIDLMDNWFPFIINKGFALLSFNFQVMMRTKPKEIEEVILKQKEKKI